MQPAKQISDSRLWLLTEADVTRVWEGLTLEFAQVDQPVISDDPGTNADWDLLACKLIL